MFVRPRQKIADDPYFPARVGLALAGGFLAVAIIEPVMQSIFIQFPFILLTTQRKALNIKKLLVMLTAGLVYIFFTGFMLAITRPVPAVMIIYIWIMFFIGFYITRSTGSTAGMPVVLFPALLSIMAMKQFYLLNFIWNDMMGAFMLAVFICFCVYFLVPPKTKEIYVQPKIEPSGNEFGGAIIRATVTVGVVFWLLSVMDYHEMYLAMACIYPLVYPTYREAAGEATDRVLGTVGGGLISILLMWLAYLNSSFIFISLCLATVGVICGYLMMVGRQTNMVYMYFIVVSMSVFMHGLYSGEQMYFIFMRTMTTVGGAIVAVMLIAILDRIFLKSIPRTGVSRHPRVQRWDFGYEID